MRRSSSALLSLSHLSTLKPSALILSILIFSTLSFAAAPDRITAPIVTAQTIRLTNGVPMQARPQFDQGAVDPSLKMGYMTLLTVPSASQKRALNKLLADQQNPHSASYHKWLTPEQYADRFGLSPNDMKKLTAWLQSEGFTIVRTARARNWIAFSGTAAQAEKTFQTQIHNYKVDGEMHFANTTPATIPVAISGVVSGVRGLNNFHLKSQARRVKPDYTFPFNGSNFLFVSPGDIATMYDINTLYENGIDGTGQKLAVIGQTGIYQADLTDFRTSFGLSAINCTTNGSDIITSCNTSNFKYDLVNGTPQEVYNDPNGRDDLPEADLDIEWSGAAARNAQVIFVTATDPNGGGVFDSVLYAIDNNVAPVVTMSYTTPCELAEIGFFDADEALFQQANSFGITFMNSSGDTGAAECDFGSNLAEFGYAVAYPASSASVTAVGGTSIPGIAPNEYNATFWGNTNGSDGGSALSYIPEQTWNDAQEFGLICTPSSPCNFTGGTVTDWPSAQDVIGISGGGGGVSNCVTADLNGVCQSGFPQPAWQAGLLASAVNPGSKGQIDPNTPTRYTPDISLLGSPNFPGYLVCTQQSALGGSGTGSTCAGGVSGMLTACFNGTGPCSIFGGTSVSSPVFAGIVALLNQDVVASGVQTVPGLGNINPVLYSLAAANSTNHAFNPVTTASSGAYSNGAWCDPGQPTSGIPSDPWPAALQCPSTGPNFLGFNTFDFDPITNYNLVTGLGSVNASHLAAALVALGSPTTTTLASSENPSNFADSVTFTATVTTTGTVTPTGTVTFNDGTTQLGTGTLGSNLDGVVNFATATFTTSTLSSGSHSITAVYGGDANNAGSTSAVLTQVVTPPTFGVSTPTTPSPVLAGLPATSTFTVTPTGTGITTFAGAVTFACSNLPDSTVGCSFSPLSIAAGQPATQVTLTITTTGPNKATDRPQKRRADNRYPWLPLTLPLAGVVMIGFAGRKKSKYSALACLCVSLVLLGLLVACGSNPPVSISVSPAGATVFPNYAQDNWPPQTATFTATVTNTSNTGVTWSLSSSVSCSANPSPCGSITGGSYTAPTIAVGLPTSVTVTATSQADSTKTASSTVTLTPTTVPTAIVGAPYNITVAVTENGNTTPVTQPVSLTVQ